MRLEIQKHFQSGDELAKQAANDLAARILTIVNQKTAHVVLTGGSVGINTLSELAPLLKGRDLQNLHLWWGDERFVEKTSKERNYVQAHQALLSHISIPLENIHSMPARNGVLLNEATTQFALEIEAIAPEFDLVLLGMGSDGHIASLFPASNPQGHGSLVIAESNSPKPPAERISLSYAALSSAREVWFLVAGADKADAVSEVFIEKKLPAALVTGTELTRWYLDAAAAKGLTF